MSINININNKLTKLIKIIKNKLIDKNKIIY